MVIDAVGIEDPVAPPTVMYLHPVPFVQAPVDPTPVHLNLDRGESLALSVVPLKAKVDDRLWRAL
jgi:hypothetical protein